MQLFHKMTRLLLLASFFTLPLAIRAQYCAPSPTTGGVYINTIDFNNSTVTGGVANYTGVNNGYTPATATTSGTVSRYFGFSFHYGLGNPTASRQSYNFAYYADWNNDNDFDDPGEQQLYPLVGAFDPGSTTPSSTVFPALNIIPGNYRLRFAVKQDSSSVATACGNYTGEVEDYIITVRTNTAPVLNTAAVPVLNRITTSQTNSSGIAISELVGSTEPAAILITDADDQGINFNSMVPRGIAIYGQTATNGSWQYKVGAGAWTDFGVLSNSNALLLLGDGGMEAYKTGTRIRFVPTGVGTPSFSFKAWDGTTGVTGGYANITATGGTTAFSTANSSASLSVIAPTGYDNNIYFSTFNNAVYKALVNRATGSITNSDPVLQNSPDYYSFDIDRDSSTTQLYWVGGQGPNQIATSNIDGSALQPSLIGGLISCTGLAVGQHRLYYWNWADDYSSAGIFKANTDGSGAVSIITGAYQYTQDIEFYKNRVYFQYSLDYTNFNIASMDTTGAGLTILYSGTNSFGGLAVANDTLYWTESDGTVNKRAIAGGATTQIALESSRFLTDLIVDPVSSRVYFLDYDINSNDRYTNLRSVAATGGVVTTVGTLNNVVSSMTFNTSAVTLPITLLNFQGRYNAETTTSMLNWQTASEENNNKFILERSTDGIHFTSVATLQGAGTTSVVHAYEYSDNVKSISAGTIYYRLQQVDADGRSAYSKIIALNKNADPAIVKLWPNPGKGYFNVHINTLPQAPVNLKVYGNDGTLLISDLITRQDYQLNLSNRQAGTYFLQLTFGNGLQKHFSIVNE